MATSLTVGRCYRHIEHTLGGSLSPALDVHQLINQAGQFLTSMQDWRWLEGVEAKLDLRAQVSTTTGVFDLAGGTPDKKLTVNPDTNWLANYTFLEGDTLEVTAGTNAKTGHYRVVSKYSDDILELESDISTTAGDLTAVSATLHTGAVALPSDFRELIAINTTSGLMKGVELTTLQDLINRRAASFVSTGYHWGAIVNAYDTSAASTQEPVPRLEIWPEPSANETGALTIFYRAGWQDVTDDANYVRVPSWIEALYLQILRAFARGYEEEDEGSLSARLAEVAGGPLFAAAIDRDASSQPDYGPLINGAAQQAHAGTFFSNFNSVDAPS